MRRICLNILVPSFIVFTAFGSLFFLRGVDKHHGVKVVSKKSVSKACKNKQQRIKQILYKKALSYSKSYVPKSLVFSIVDQCLKVNHSLLVLSIITEESHFDIFARSRSGAVGCGQIKWKFWKERLRSVGINSYRDMFDPKLCVQAVNFVFSYYLNKVKDPVKALQLYYCGENNPDCKVGRYYADKVLATYARYSFALRQGVDDEREILAFGKR